MANSRDFFVKEGGVALIGKALSFTVIARDTTGAERDPPEVEELGEGVYRVTPTDEDETIGTVISIDCGDGREPRRSTFACYQANGVNQFWAVHIENPEGTFWEGTGPTIGSYRSSDGPRDPPTPVAVEGSWLWVVVPSGGDIAVDTELLLIGPAGSAQPEWLGSTDPLVESTGSAGGGSKFNTGFN